MSEVARHYDLLIDEGNDPVLDPPELAAYMDSWDGGLFICALQLNGTQDVLEIGVGTGRLAVRIVPSCRTFTGVDISQKTTARAAEHLAAFSNAAVICADFMAWDAGAQFDVVYSSLTFMHLQDKRGAAQKAAALIRPGGRLVLSLDKGRSGVIDDGTRKLVVYPDDPVQLTAHLTAAGMTVLPVQETERAYILIAMKGESD